MLSKRRFADTPGVGDYPLTPPPQRAHDMNMTLKNLTAEEKQAAELNIAYVEYLLALRKRKKDTESR